MKKQVLETTCDNCGSVERVDFADANAEFTLPKNWMNVVGRRNGGTVFELDLCPTDTMMILAAGGRMPASIKKPKVETAMEVGSPEHDQFVADQTMIMALEDERIRKIDLLSEAGISFLDNIEEESALFILNSHDPDLNRITIKNGMQMTFKGEKHEGALEYLKEKWNK